MLRQSWLRHCRRFSCLILRHGLCVSTFLRPLAPRALLRFFATMDALTPVGRLFGPSGHEHRSKPDGSPCLFRPHFQPFCPQPPRRSSHRISVRSPFISARGRRSENRTSFGKSKEDFLRGSGPRLRSPLESSPTGLAESGSLCVMSFMSRRYGRVVHLRQLSTPCYHDAVAFGFRQVNVLPGRDSHPAVCTLSQAH